MAVAIRSWIPPPPPGTNAFKAWNDQKKKERDLEEKLKRVKKGKRLKLLYKLGFLTKNEYALLVIDEL